MSAAAGAGAGASDAAFTCFSPGCGAPASMRCPTCRTLSLEPPAGMFCGKACFAANWDAHKKFHATVSRLQAAAPSTSAAPSSLRASREFDGYSFTGALRPGAVSARRPPPEGLPRPDYALTGAPRSEDAVRSSNVIAVHSAADIEAARRAGAIGREVLDAAAAALRPGATGEEIDAVVFAACAARGVYPSPLNYRGFPKSVCVCVGGGGRGGPRGERRALLLLRAKRARRDARARARATPAPLASPAFSQLCKRGHLPRHPRLAAV